MKITKTESETKNKRCKHEVGKVYREGSIFTYLVKGGNKYCFVYFRDNSVGKEFDDLDEIDATYPNDIEVDAELIIHEVK